MCYLGFKSRDFFLLGGGEGGGEILKDVYVCLSYFDIEKGN